MADKPSPSVASELDVGTLIAEISESNDADILLFNAELERGVDDVVIASVKAEKRHPNLMMILVTPGGDADAAYKMTRYIQEEYEKFIVFVPGICKSAGTLCVLGANEIVMCDEGELGPLDVQLYKKDEIGELSSGLVLGEALSVTQSQAFSMFEKYMLDIKRNSSGQISFKMAAEIAGQLVVGLFEPVYRQVDPMLIGEVQRSMTVAEDYGRRLQVRSRNFTEEALLLLIQSYPSHSFVIDRREATQLFRNVREANKSEESLAVLLEPISRVPSEKGQIAFLTEGLDEQVKETADGKEADESAKEKKRGNGSNASNPRSAKNAETANPATSTGTGDPSSSSENRE